MFEELFVNFCIMTTLTVIGSFFIRLRSEFVSTWGERLQVFLSLWLAGFVLMRFPIDFAPGVIMAFYAVPVGTAALFGGVGWGLMAGAPLVLYRLWLGGPGALPGLAHVTAVAVVAGLLKMGPRAVRVAPMQVLWRAVVIFAVGNLSMLLIPGMGFTVFATFYPRMMPLSALGMFLCVQLIKTRVEAQRRLDTATTQAHVDVLTGLPNQRSLMEAVEGLSIGERYLFLLLDIDHFKHVNDTYGHLAGDEVLRHLARLLQTEMRSTDLVCRYGGEEFAVLMRGCTPGSALDVAERLRLAVAAAPFRSGSERIPVTISGGLVSLYAEQPFARQFKAADALLYQAKQSGRNRIEHQ